MGVCIVRISLQEMWLGQETLPSNTQHIKRKFIIKQIQEFLRKWTKFKSDMIKRSLNDFIRMGLMILHLKRVIILRILQNQIWNLKRKVKLEITERWKNTLETKVHSLKPENQIQMTWKTALSPSSKPIKITKIFTQ